MTFTLRSQAFCFFIHITIICHEIPQFIVCPLVLCEGICITFDVLLFCIFLQGLVSCMGGKIIAGILERYVKDPRHTRSGFPDLTLWNTENKTFKVYSDAFRYKISLLQTEKGQTSLCSVQS